MIKSVFIRRGCLLLVISVLSATPVSAALLLATSTTFDSAFTTARAGDTIQMTGTFDGLRLQNRSFAKTVTLDATKATFTQALQLWSIDNMKVVGGTFKIAGGALYSRAAAAYNGSNITFIKQTVFGSAGQYGILIDSTTNGQVSYGTFHGLRAAIQFSSANNGLATKNRIYEADSDGIDIADSHFVTASYNSCSLGNPGIGVHADCIQLYSFAGKPLQSDITVAYNTATGPTQGFTSFRTGGGGLRLHIVNNTVNTSLPQGVACYDCIDSDVSFNHVGTLPGSAYQTRLNVIGGSNNRVVGNFVAAFTPVRAAAADFDAVDSFAEDAGPAAASGLLAASSAAAVPEPSSWTLLILGFGGIGRALRRQARGAGTRQPRIA